MPLVKFDLVKGRSQQEITHLLDVSHRIFLDALELPEGDRYQVVTQHEPYELVMEDTGLGFERTHQRVLITVVSRKRTTEQKEKLYEQLQQALYKECQLKPEDLMINFVINEDEDWSFGFGKAQFLTVDLQ